MCLSLINKNKKVVSKFENINKVEGLKLEIKTKTTKTVIKLEENKKKDKDKDKDKDKIKKKKKKKDGELRTLWVRKKKKAS